jgi:hypothetical protein
MENSASRALVPISANLPATTQTQQRKARNSGRAEVDFDLVRRETYLRDRKDVEEQLPDIIGRALARIWIDGHFRDRFAAGPVETLAAYGVYLPQNITIDFETEGLTRPQVVVYEKRFRHGPRRRLLSLRLMMLADK